MSSRKIVLALGLPLGSAGLLAAHALAYRLAAPPGREHAHAYLGAVHQLPMLAIAAVLGALALEAAGARRGRTRSAPSERTFLVALPLAFTVQEHLERLLVHEPPPLLEPVFLLGLALQLPFALACYLAARALLGLADRAGRAHAPRSAPPAPFAAVTLAPAAPIGLPSGFAPTARPRGRAPPLAVVR